MKKLMPLIVLALALTGHASRAHAVGEYVSLDASYSPHLSFVTEGSKTSFGFAGGRADLDFHLPFFTRQDGYLVSWGIYASYGNYVNAHKADDATETLKTKGGGFSTNFCTKQIPNLHLFGNFGYLKLDLDQTGPAKRFQNYNALDFRIGLGVGPMVGSSGIYFRANLQFIGSVGAGKENGTTQELREISGAGMNYQLGYAFAF